MTSLTPGQVALRLGVPSEQVRSVAATLFDSREEQADSLTLTESMTRQVQTELGASDSPSELPGWYLEPGDVVLRRDLHDVYSGSRYHGIVPLAAAPEIFVFTDPVKGAKHGYDKFEGLMEDGSYSYTGEGQSGDQQFTKGNKRLLESVDNGKTIRLFTTRGTSATYVGAFTLGSPPYRIDRIPDSAGQERDGIIFSLVPLNADSSRLPTYGGTAPAQSLVLSEWSPPDTTDVIAAATEQPAEERVVSRVEHDLQARFGQWLTEQGEPPQNLRLPVSSVTIEPDMYVPSRRWIVEAKKSTARSYVRMAIGQVLDYVHTARRLGLETVPAILLPGVPEDDLLDLASGLGIVVITHTPEWVKVL